MHIILSAAVMWFPADTLKMIDRKRAGRLCLNKSAMFLNAQIHRLSYF